LHWKALLVFGQTKVRQYGRFSLQRGQSSHDAEAGALLQMQIQHGHIHIFLNGHCDRHTFCVGGAD
jgi:hypothetical protein